MRQVQKSVTATYAAQTQQFPVQGQWTYQAGVLEYWIIDSHGRAVEIHVLRDGAYELVGHWGEEVARSELLEGFAVSVNEIIPA